MAGDKAKAPTTLVRARVVGVQYGRHAQGEIVEVSPGEYVRAGRSILMSEADEIEVRKSDDDRRAAALEANKASRSTAPSPWAVAAKDREGRQVLEDRRNAELARQFDAMKAAADRRDGKQ